MRTAVDRLRWHPDEFGRSGRALYFMSLYAGEVQHVPNHPRQGSTWRAWAQTGPDLNELGWYQTEDEAKAALLGEVWRAINDPLAADRPHEGETG
jgi:hypothetical protein